MPGVESRDFDSHDETRTPEKTQVDVVSMGAATVGRFAFEPGWRWSECVKPVAGTESCQARHVGVVHAGRLAHQARGRNRGRDLSGRGVRHRARPRRVGGRRRAVRRIRVRVAIGGGIREGLGVRPEKVVPAAARGGWPGLVAEGAMRSSVVVVLEPDAAQPCAGRCRPGQAPALCIRPWLGGGRTARGGSRLGCFSESR